MLINDNFQKNDPFLTTLGLAKKAGKLVVGWDRISDYSGKIIYNIVSCDASERTRLNAEKKAEIFPVDYSMQTIGEALGIKRAAVIAVVDPGFAELLRNKSKQ